MRWIREAVGRHYLIAFDVQLTLENNIDSEPSSYSSFWGYLA